MNGEVTVTVQAAPARVWSLVSDITRIGEFSPETFEAQWVGTPPRPVVGARFRGHLRRNGRGPVYWTDCRVLRCEPERVFDFGVYARDRLVNTWSYQLREVVGGTAVTESFRLPRTPLTRLYWAVAGRSRARTNDRGMRHTLARVKAVAEAAALGTDTKEP